MMARLGDVLSTLFDHFQIVVEKFTECRGAGLEEAVGEKGDYPSSSFQEYFISEIFRSCQARL